MEGYDSDGYLYDEDDEIHDDDAAPELVCEWHLFDDEMNAWQGECYERAFVFNDGTPVDNGWLRCPYCGHVLQEMSDAG